MIFQLVQRLKLRMGTEPRLPFLATILLSIAQKYGFTIFYILCRCFFSSLEFSVLCLILAKVVFEAGRYYRYVSRQARLRDDHFSPGTRVCPGEIGGNCVFSNHDYCTMPIGASIAPTVAVNPRDVWMPTEMERWMVDREVGMQPSSSNKTIQGMSYYTNEYLLFK